LKVCANRWNPPSPFDKLEGYGGQGKKWLVFPSQREQKCIDIVITFIYAIIMNTTLQIRIDSKTKKDAQKVFKELGLDMSSGVKLFLQQVVNTESIPFPLRTANGFTVEKERKILAETAHGIKHNKRYSTSKEMFCDILK
jgi:DNA-damage-inducible protein J